MYSIADGGTDNRIVDYFLKPHTIWGKNSNVSDVKINKGKENVPLNQEL